MPVSAQIHACCSKCGGRHDVDVPATADVSANPELKEKILSGELFLWQCPVCGTRNLIKYPLVYHDPAERLILVLTDAMLNAEGLQEGYTGRMVRSVGELIEKIKIFDAGLDDVVIEMCKYVMTRETGRTLELKFFRMDGADGELTFTYPDNGQMQMLSLGANVYEDCRAIVARNPAMQEAAQGLVCVDSGWLGLFMA